MKTICVNLQERSYPIFLERGLLNRLDEVLDLQARTFLITDSGVPAQWVNKVSSQLPNCLVHVVEQGEQAKSFAVYEECIRTMLHHQFSRQDRIIALGGGVVGDLAGFVAASYMRGIDFIQIPTTTLSQIDSSIGGKVAINVDTIKNCVGAFWQPKQVVIDPDTLTTLSHRHFCNGLVEAVKAGFLGDERLVELFETGMIEEHLEEILVRALEFKKSIVEQDEKENGLRRILNFGHTFGHGIESAYHLSQIYHGEAVALGMMMVLDSGVLRERLRQILQQLKVLRGQNWNPKIVYEFMLNDKKGRQEGVSLILLEAMQKPVIQEVSWKTIRAMLERGQQ